MSQRTSIAIIAVFWALLKLTKKLNASLATVRIHIPYKQLRVALVGWPDDRSSFLPPTQADPAEAMTPEDTHFLAQHDFS